MELQELKTDLQELHEAVKQLDSISKKLHLAVSDGSEMHAQVMMGQSQQSEHVGTALKYFAILAGVALIGMTYGVCIRQAKSKEKKFV